MCTEEFASDIDALRKAADFREENSVDVLVKTLGLGVKLWGEGERGILMEGL
jgi:hypothetical protein